MTYATMAGTVPGNGCSSMACATRSFAWCALIWARIDRMERASPGRGELPEMIVGNDVIK